MADRDRTVRKRKARKADGGSDPYYSRAVGKALQVLEFLRSEQASAPLHQIARHIQLSKTSAFRLVRTLQMSDCLTLNASGAYQLTRGYQAVGQIQWLGRLIRTAIPRMQSLSADLGETVSLAALFENRSEVVAVVESPHPIRMSNVVGHILPPNASSLGKAITAFQAPERREKLLRSFGAWRFTKNTITDAAALRKEFDLVRDRKFATDREETVVDGICFGVPIFGDDGDVPAAISSSFPKARIRNAAHEEDIVAQLQSAAAAIAGDLRKVR